MDTLGLIRDARAGAGVADQCHNKNKELTLYFNGLLTAMRVLSATSSRNHYNANKLGLRDNSKQVKGRLAGPEET
jgi:hypothetical protein